MDAVGVAGAGVTGEFCGNAEGASWTVAGSDVVTCVTVLPDAAFGSVATGGSVEDVTGFVGAEGAVGARGALGKAGGAFTTADGVLGC